MIVVYTNKPSISKRISPALSQKYPKEEIVYIHSMHFMNISFVYPQNIKWNQFPYIQKPIFKINPILCWNPLNFINENLESTYISFDEISTANKIIYVNDDYSSDNYLFKYFLENINIDNTNAEVLNLYSFNSQDIITSIENMSNISFKFMESANEGYIKKYFDYNYNFNSLALIGKAYQQVNNIFKEHPYLYTKNHIMISKYMLQLLYFIYIEQTNNNIYKESHIIFKMINWNGTGKYSLKESLGNEISRTTIIQNLLQLKLIEHDYKFLKITDKGILFINSLPKDCKDFDLPFRINQWSKLPFEEIQSNIDFYLINYFKKIKNKLKAIKTN